MSSEKSANATGGQPAERPPVRRRGLQSMSRVVARVGRPMWRKRGLAESRIITDWPQVVGETLAQWSLPVRLSQGHLRGADGPPEARGPAGPGGAGGVLHVRVAGSWAVELHHMAPQIVERVNAHLGFAAIAELKLEQGPVTGPPPRRRPPETPPEAKAAVRETVATVEDEGLRDALTRLGDALNVSSRRQGRPKKG